MSTHIPCEAESIRFEPLTDAQIAQFDEQGYLILSNVMSDEEANRLTGWTKEVKESTPSSGAGYMPYMEIDKQGRRVLTVSEVNTSDKLTIYSIPHASPEFLQYA